MAITFSWFKNLDNQLGSENTTATLTGVAVGTRVLCAVSLDYYTAGSIGTPTGTAVTTWTLLNTGDAGSNNPHVKVWSGVVTTAGGTVIGSGTGQFANGAVNVHVAACSGVDTTTSTSFVDVSANAANGTNTTAHTATGVTTTAADDMLVVFTVGADSDGGVTTASSYGTPNAGMTRQAEGFYDSAGTRFADHAAYTEQLSASGATGTRSLTYPVNAGYASITVALKGTSGHAAAAIAVSTAVTSDALATRVGAAALTVAAQVTAAADRTIHATAALTAGATVTAGALATRNAAAALAVTAQVTADAVRDTPAQAAIGVTATVNATEGGALPAQAAVTVDATVTATALRILPALATITVAATVTAAGSADRAATSTIQVTATITAAAIATRLAAAALVASVTVTAAATVGISATETPTERTYLIPAESRTYTVPAESRTLTVPVDDRD